MVVFIAVSGTLFVPNAISKEYRVCIHDDQRYDAIANVVEGDGFVYGEKYFDWKTALDENTTISMVVSKGGCDIHIHTSKNIKLRDDGGEIGGQWIPLYQTITIYNIDNQSDMHLKAVVMHEIGHVMGLGHVENSFMSERINLEYSYIPKSMITFK